MYNYPYGGNSYPYEGQPPDSSWHSSIMSSNMAQDTNNHKPRDTRKVVTPHPRASILNLPANINNLLRSPLASQRPWFRPRLHP
ncbi:hypothetical protein VTJ04DRAFT_166 [Mycothermus thermophilus]|uniref:uncharacterized protein n=1 Tax=Humicola insolens TaxID=85995 RepID=UPI0037438B0E